MSTTMIIFYYVIRQRRFFSKENSPRMILSYRKAINKDFCVEKTHQYGTFCIEKSSMIFFQNKYSSSMICLCRKITNDFFLIQMSSMNTLLHRKVRKVIKDESFRAENSHRKFINHDFVLKKNHH